MVADSSAKAMISGVKSSVHSTISNGIMSKASSSANSQRHARNSKPGAGIETGEGGGCWNTGRLGVWNSWRGRFGVWRLGWLRIGVRNSKRPRLGSRDEYRLGDSERDHLQDKPPGTGIRDAMRRVIMSLLPGVGIVDTMPAPERPQARMEEICPLCGPSKASMHGGSCFVPSLDAYRRYSDLKHIS